MYIQRGLFGPFWHSPGTVGSCVAKCRKMAENHKITSKASKVAFLGGIGVGEEANALNLQRLSNGLRWSVIATGSCVNLFSRLIFSCRVL